MPLSLPSLEVNLLPQVYLFVLKVLAFVVTDLSSEHSEARQQNLKPTGLQRGPCLQLHPPSPIRKPVLQH